MRRRVSGGRAAGACGGEPTGGLTPDISGGTGRCHPDFNPADAEPHQSADLEQLETNGATRGVGKVRLIQADATQGAQQHVGHRRKPQAQLVSSHGSGRGTIGIKIELALFDPVLHIAAGTVDCLIKIARFALGTCERGDDEARIGVAVRPLSFGDNPALAAPALACPPLELLETPCWLFSWTAASSLVISALSRSFWANPKTKCTPFASHQAISSSRAKPLSARNRMRTRGHFRRMWATMRATSSTEPAAASTLARRSLAASRCRPQNT